MEPEVQNNQQNMDNQQNMNYQDPLATGVGAAQPEKKKGGTGSLVGSTVAAVLVWRLFGLIGGLICYGGFWGVRAIIKSKMPVAAKVVLSILVILGLLILMFVYILFVASLEL